MPIVVVVDDSEVDRRLVAGILARDIDWLVEFAKDGREAVSLIIDTSPDIIITDLQMPVMNGIELCRAGREKFPHIPIIVTTGKGSEDLAMEALREGAASYVPKSSLADTLSVTVEQMLALSRKNVSRARLMKYTTNSRFQFRLENDPSLLPPLIDFLCDSMKMLRFGDAAKIRQVSVAVEEAILNALFHGNLELNEFQAREARNLPLETGEEHELVTNRRESAPYEERRILFGADLSRGKVQFVIRDQGPGFDISTVPAAADTTNLSNEKKRGLKLIRNFMPDVSFNDTGNEIRMAMDLTQQHAPASVN